MRSSLVVRIEGDLRNEQPNDLDGAELPGIGEAGQDSVDSV